MASISGRIMRTKSIILRERDYEILAAIEKWGILGLAQLDGLVFKKEAGADERIRLFFNESKRELYTLACYKRLRDIERAGYVRSHFYVNQPKLHTLTEKGHRALLEVGRAMLPGYRRSISEYLLRHEIAVNGVGLAIEQLLGLSVRSERQRAPNKRPGWQMPDPTKSPVADLWIVDEAQPKAIEVELTQKAERRYKAIWDAYRYRLPNGGILIYLTSWPSGPAHILSLAREYRVPFLFVASLKEFRESQGRCRFLGPTREEPYLSLAPAFRAEDPQVLEVR